jgi:cytochrome c553
MRTLYIFIITVLYTVSAGAQEIYSPSQAERATWNKLLARGVEQIAFVKRFTYDSNHYYTEFLNSKWMPGGNLCILSLSSGEVRELAPSLSGGVFGAFDVSFDAKRIVFAYKANPEIGYRLYEVGVDGEGLRQLTFSPDNEDEIVGTYRLPGYHHGTEDLDPCYLPDGGIAFISTRCHFGILCDAPDLFPTTVLYRIDGDGSNMRQLTNSSVSENTPCVLPDGRIMYTRWEYVDKGAVSVKCLWAMNPDGSNSVEIYGNDVAIPTTMVMGRPIPDSPNEYVFTGTPHCPQNCVGTIIRINTTKNIRTSEPMTYITPYTDIRYEPGFAFRDLMDTSRWYQDGSGRGPLFRESYPLSRSEFLASHKLAGPRWSDAKAYQLYLLYEGGRVEPLYRDSAISCFRPVPLVARAVPPVIPSYKNKELAAKNLAECIVTDVYSGMVGVEKGSIKYLRILEQVPRPWGARRFYQPNYTQDEYDQQHVAISKDTHLGLKIQHGVATVEDDGSARFLVPAGRNIFLQALDANYKAIQTERTYVNYMPGEVRSCIGCHESTSQTPRTNARQTPKAMKRAAEMPLAQAGERSAAKTLSYARDVQPVWDKHCIRCHNADNAKGNLNLAGTETRLFNESYENLVPERRKGGGVRARKVSRDSLSVGGHEYYIAPDGTYFRPDVTLDAKYTTEGKGYYVASDGGWVTTVLDKGLLGPVIGENHPKNGNIRYLPAKSLGSYASILVAMFSPDVILDSPDDRKKAQHLATVHNSIKLKPEELLQITNWVDTNCQYYGTYYGRRDTIFKSHPDYRTEYDVATAVSPNPPVPYK